MKSSPDLAIRSQYLFYYEFYILYTKHKFFFFSFCFLSSSLFIFTFILNHILYFSVFVCMCFFILSMHFLDRYFDGFCLSVIKAALNPRLEFQPFFSSFSSRLFFSVLFFSFSYSSSHSVALLFNHRKKYPYNYTENNNAKRMN